MPYSIISFSIMLRVAMPYSLISFGSVIWLAIPYWFISFRSILWPAMPYSFIFFWCMQNPSTGCAILSVSWYFRFLLYVVWTSQTWIPIANFASESAFFGNSYITNHKWNGWKNKVSLILFAVIKEAKCTGHVNECRPFDWLFTLFKSVKGVL